MDIQIIIGALVTFFSVIAGIYKGYRTLKEIIKNLQEDLSEVKALVQKPWKAVCCIILRDSNGNLAWDIWKEKTDQPCDQAWPRPTAKLCSLLGFSGLLKGNFVNTEYVNPDTEWNLYRKDEANRVEYYTCVVDINEDRPEQIPSPKDLPEEAKERFHYVAKVTPINRSESKA